MYNNLKDYDKTLTYMYNVKDFLTGSPIGRRAVNHDFYNKLNMTALYDTADFNQLEHDSLEDYDNMVNKAVGLTVPETLKIYYNKDLI